MQKCLEFFEMIRQPETLKRLGLQCEAERVWNYIERSNSHWIEEETEHRFYFIERDYDGSLELYQVAIAGQATLPCFEAQVLAWLEENDPDRDDLETPFLITTTKETRWILQSSCNFVKKFILYPPHKEKAV